MLSREEIIQVYNQGPEAVVALVMGLFEIIERQQIQIDQLTARVRDLEDRLAQNSRNSSQPPSSDSLVRRTQSMRRPSGKKPGGQKGHEGKTLKAHANPNQIQRHSPQSCGKCGQGLESVDGIENEERRQVLDLPPLNLEVTEHRTVNKICPCCGEVTSGAFPSDITPGVQYGHNLKALVVYLINYQLIPWQRTCELISDLVGQPIAEGTLASVLAECSMNLTQPEREIMEAIKEAKIGNFDESGFYVAGRRHWVHVASTEFLTHYGTHPKRGAKAMDEIGILPAFGGRAMHDHFQPYFNYPCDHGLCNAHHLRELTFIYEQKNQAWAGDMKQLLIDIKKAVDEAARAGARALPLPEQRKFKRAYDRHIARGLKLPENQPQPRKGKRGPVKQSKAKNLLDRLSQHKQETLAFMADFDIPFDNNQAERDIRMLKVQQKISGCFRTEQGAKNFCRIRGYISTIKKQGHNVLLAITSVLSGQPLSPLQRG